MDDFKNLELDEIMEWPRLAQGVVLALLFIAIQVVGYCFYLLPKQEQVETMVAKEQELKTELKIKADKAARLPLFTAQMEQISQQYRHLLQQLPEQNELANILASVNEFGIQHQLVISRIEWDNKEHLQFLYRIPLSIELAGNYHDIAMFSQAIAQLPRIIYFEHVDWQRSREDSKLLNVNIQAYTYQYREEEKHEK